MSWETQAWVWSLPDLAANERLVALAFGNHGDSYGNELRPGVSRLCHMTGLSESTVKRSIKTLLDAGILILVRETDGRGVANEYRMPVDMEQVAAYHKKGFKFAQAESERGSHRPERGSHRPDKGVQAEPPDSNNKHSGNSESRDSRFAAFWEAYPARQYENGSVKKNGKAAAQRYFDAALKEISFDDLMVAVAAFAKATEPRYVPDPERWLKNKRWTDDILPGLAPAENAGAAQLNGHAFKIAASAPPDAWKPLAQKMSEGDDGTLHPEAHTIFLDFTAMDICAITGLDPDEPRADWPVMIEWARAGMFEMKDSPWKEYLLPELRRICAKPGYKTPGGLAYFTPALQRNWT